MKEIDEWAGFCSLFKTYDPSRQDSHITRQSQDLVRLYNHILSYTIKGRRLFKTRSGLLGIGPEDCKVGDSIVVFLGGRTPFVTRPVTRIDSPDSKKFFCELVGDCYVHGIMDGSATRESRVMDFWIT